MTKIITMLLLSAMVLAGCGSKKDKGTESKDQNNSKIEFESTTFDFGKIEYASDGTCRFIFKNVSDEPLIINVVRTSCGCTNPEWPKDPLKPGDQGEIKVTYNTKIPGSFQKNVTVFCNAVNSPVKLLIKGEVQPDPSEASSSSSKQ